jgi:HJR/Mrr/RecB family endonuclease
MRKGVLIAVQCQRYNRPIGTKSVQEACARKTDDRPGTAVVIGTSGFTPAAIEGESLSKRNSDRIEKSRHGILSDVSLRRNLVVELGPSA